MLDLERIGANLTQKDAHLRIQLHDSRSNICKPLAHTLLSGVAELRNSVDKDCMRPSPVTDTLEKRLAQQRSKPAENSMSQQRSDFTVTAHAVRDIIPHQIGLHTPRSLVVSSKEPGINLTLSKTAGSMNLAEAQAKRIDFAWTSDHVRIEGDVVRTLYECKTWEISLESFREDSGLFPATKGSVASAKMWRLTYTIIRGLKTDAIVAHTETESGLGRLQNPLGHLPWTTNDGDADQDIEVKVLNIW